MADGSLLTINDNMQQRREFFVYHGAAVGGVVDVVMRMRAEVDDSRHPGKWALQVGPVSDPAKKARLMDPSSNPG